MQNVQMIAGFASSLIFVTSNLPMLFKAIQTRNLKSYSPVHLVLSNLGNLIYWLYVASLPLGPIWFLHGFFTLTTLIMLVLYLRFEGGAGFFGRHLSLKVSKK
jgi:hypothetical protein